MRIQKGRFMNIRKHLASLLLVFYGIIFVCVSFVNSQELFNEDLLKTFTYRNLGPFRSGAWIVDFAVPEYPQEAHLYTFYVASRNGGLWKTTNNGTTFEPIFDDQTVFSIGDIALAPSNPDIVWVGTGEAANARSSYWGDGVYKSTDGGKTWKNMGLEDSHHIGRIVVHPKNPDVVYVAAMGHLYSFNEERGVFKTVDGGKTWEKVLYINERVGVIDVAMNRDNPDILYAAAYEKQRLPWHFEAGGPGSAIYKTIDAGETWAKLGEGLPGGKIGRIGLDIYRKNPDIVFAVVENVNKRPSTKEEVEQDRRRGIEPQERVFGGEVYRTDNAGRTWKKMNSIKDNVGGKAAYSFCQIRVDPNNDKNVYVTSICVASSNDSGKTWHDVNWPPRKMFKTSFGDVRTLWIDPQNSNRIFMGSDGGVHISYDGGKTCDFYDNLPMAQYYAIGVDMEDPYNIYGGLQCHDSWKVPSNSWSGQITLEDLVTVGTGDGMYNVVDPNDSRWVYNTSQFGGHHCVDQKLGIRTNIQPRREKGRPPYRFNWCPPVHISPHNSEIIYAGTQVLLRSMQRGDNWQEISPDLTTNDAVKIAGKGHIQYCTITTISESPVTPGIIWVGTDDGKVWLTKDYGASWADLTQKIVLAGGPENYWVSRVFASNFKEGTAYISKTGYRRDDFRPFIYKTTDFGETWTAINDNLPNKPINVVFEDRKNPDLLFLGTDMGVYVTINEGKKWVYMRNNMPTIAVHDLLVHPRENDLVVGTYGRGLYITDVTLLQELNEKVLDEDIHFFKVEPKVQRITRAWGAYYLYGDRHLTTPNEPNRVVINYYLKNKAKEKAKITITDPYGKVFQ
ncbi:MAG: hypothetical protein KAU91_05930, partial [Candidatus Aminicenantes bacterium]|nr:hypothetical protein [Candidatus Aminicenantes bacterium]